MFIPHLCFLGVTVCLPVMLLPSYRAESKKMRNQSEILKWPLPDPRASLSKHNRLCKCCTCGETRYLCPESVEEKEAQGALQIREKYVTLSSSLWAKSQGTRADLSHCPTQKALRWWYAWEWWIFMSKKQELWCLFGCHYGNDLLVLGHTGPSADFTHLAQHFLFFTSRLHYIYLLDSFLWQDQAELIFFFYINYSHSQTITCLSTV